MTDLNNDICELSANELDEVCGGKVAEYFAGLVAAAATNVAGGGGGGGGGIIGVAGAIEAVRNCIGC
jgi:hypothetical protein